MTIREGTTGETHIHCLCTTNTVGKLMCCKCHKTQKELLLEIRERSHATLGEAWQRLADNAD